MSAGHSGRTPEETFDEVPDGIPDNKIPEELLK